MRGSGEAGLGACLTHGRGELRSSRKEGTKNGVKNLKGAADIPSAFSCFYLFISYPGILKRDEPHSRTLNLGQKSDRILGKEITIKHLQGIRGHKDPILPEKEHPEIHHVRMGSAGDDQPP